MLAIYNFLCNEKAINLAEKKDKWIERRKHSQVFFSCIKSELQENATQNK